MKLAFLAKYRESGLLILRVSIGLLFLYVAVPALLGGESQWARSGNTMRVIGIATHYPFWGLVGLISSCVTGVLMILGLFFRPAVLLGFVIAILRAIRIADGRGGFEAAMPTIEMCVILLSLLFIGAGKYSVDKS